MTQLTVSVCPFLGLAGEPTTARTQPDAAHRCYAQQPPAAPDLDHQAAFCLAATHDKCPFYDASLAARDRMPEAAADKNQVSRRNLVFIRGRMLLWAALAVVALIVIAIYARDLLRRPTPILPTATPRGAAITVEASATPSLTPPPIPTADSGQALPLATAAPGGRVLSLTPGAGDAGWFASGEAQGNHLGDSYLYSGYFGGQAFVAALRIDLTNVPRGAPILEATLRLTGLAADRFTPAAGGAWTVHLLAPTALSDFGRATFQELVNAPATITLVPTLYPADLAAGRPNTWTLDAAGRAWLEEQLLDNVGFLIARVSGPAGGADTLFAWDSGAGPATLGQGPQLVLSLGTAPPTPPPLPTEGVIVATLTATPANLLTVAAGAWTATAVAQTTGTYTPLPYRAVTPTPRPVDLATVQTLALLQGLPPIVPHTPTPGNAATATADALLATAQAFLTGTPTATPRGAVTPVVVLPTPIPQNVVTAAAQMRAATAQAAQAGTPTPLPFNAMIATRTSEPFIFLDTPTPANAVTAQALAAYATAVAVTTGTFTPLPPDAVRATRTPVPTLLPLVLYLDQLPPSTRPSPTPTIPATLPRELVGKILFVSDRDGAPTLFALDPASGRLAYVTQNWPYALALVREPRSPDGNKTVIVAENNLRIPQLYLRDAQFKDALKQLTTVTGMCYDPVWSPVGDQIALVSEEPGNAEIYTIAADGSDFRRLTANNWEWDKHPSWSPNGTQIVFWSNRVTGRRQLWIMNADGTGQRQLMDSPYNDWDPIWVK